MVYQPMLELLAYLRANGFKTFIVSGGGIEFMRPWTERVYGIPPEQVVGSSIKTKYELRDGKPVIVQACPSSNFIDDKAGKPVGIQQHIGRRPIVAFGNSDGDFQMLRMDHQRQRPTLRPDRPPHRRRTRVGLRPRVAHRQARQGPRRSEAKGWTVVEHEGRLEQNLSMSMKTVVITLISDVDRPRQGVIATASSLWSI